MRLNRTLYTKTLSGHAGEFLCAPFPGLWQIRINPKYRGDMGLLVHEMTHCLQYMASPWTYMWRILLDADYRLKSELECYAMQYLAYPDAGPKLLWKFARYLSKNYRLNISTGYAHELLESEVMRVRMASRPSQGTE